MARPQRIRYLRLRSRPTTDKRERTFVWPPATKLCQQLTFFEPNCPRFKKDFTFLVSDDGKIIRRNVQFNFLKARLSWQKAA